ncbi:uncharacterized protein LOC120115210 [Hibiscus syriacus]|uniref:uncharacterized protein LOC120115210 n=1 Tax=Hibiscus syriacus TaxID=106335 RepID=UPI001921EB0E|nr:uncharacterized protein LOC120115210 [Hibiscus syriacus]
MTEKIRRTIREEIGEEKFCVIIDEAGDVSRKQQMAIILRYVDNFGLVKERFFSIIHVPNTLAVTLKYEIFYVLSRYCFDIKNIRGQGYDGSSNMREKWNGLQTLVSNECPFAYYVHCFAHLLQLALVAAAKEVIHVYQFFSNLSFISNVVLASYKCIDELKNAYSNEINHLIEEEKLEIGTGLNQTTDAQLQELNSRFNEKSIELLTLGCALESRDSDKIFNLVNKFYSEDFTEVEKNHLRTELRHYEVELSWNSCLRKLLAISDLCQWLVDTRKVNTYPYIFRTVKLLLTLPVSKASAERDFSTMNIIKTTLRIKMEHEFFESCMLIDIESDIARSFSITSLVDAFQDLKEWRVLL